MKTTTGGEAAEVGKGDRLGERGEREEEAEEEQQQQQQPVQRSQNKQNRCALFSCCCGAEGGGAGGQPGSLAYCGCCRPTWPPEVSVKKPTTTSAATG